MGKNDMVELAQEAAQAALKAAEARVAGEQTPEDNVVLPDNIQPLERLEESLRLSKLAQNIVIMERQMKRRQPAVIPDYLGPTHSNLLDVMLLDRLGADDGQAAAAPGRDSVYLDVGVLRPLKAQGKQTSMPIGHHLAYFPPYNRPDRLMGDGTIPEHHPGEPFGARLWAGGKVDFKPHWQKLMPLDGQLALCVEKIDDVRWVFRGREETETGEKPAKPDIRGQPRKDKLYVDVVRRYGPARPEQVPSGYAERTVVEDPCIQETRTLAFIRKLEPVGMDGRYAPPPVSGRRPKSETSQEGPERGEQEGSTITSEEKVKADASEKPVKGALALPTRIRPHRDLDPLTVSQTFTPSRRDLFHFSALSYNAHAIHYDQAGAAEDSLPSVLVQGPLTLLLMLQFVGKLVGEERVGSIDYRNLTPALVDEELILCAKPFERSPKKREAANETAQEDTRTSEALTESGGGAVDGQEEDARATPDGSSDGNTDPEPSSYSCIPTSDTITVWIQRPRDNRVVARGRIQLFSDEELARGLQEVKIAKERMTLSEEDTDREAAQRRDREIESRNRRWNIGGTKPQEPMIRKIFQGLRPHTNRPIQARETVAENESETKDR